jgi:hypothetical protein
MGKRVRCTLLVFAQGTGRKGRKMPTRAGDDIGMPGLKLSEEIEVGNKGADVYGISPRKR